MSNLLTLVRLIVLALASACGAASPALPKPSDAPHVIGWKPGDELERPDAALSFTFDRDMVGIEAVGPVIEQAPVSVTPALPLRVHWQDRRTLVVAPETQWKVGERYDLRFTGEPLAHTGEPRSFRFDALPLRLRYVSLPADNVPRKPSFVAAFSLAVLPAQAQDHCALTLQTGQRVKLSARASEPAPNAPPTTQRIHFESNDELPRSTHFQLDCQGLQPAHGGAPFRPDPAAAGYRTHGTLALSRAWPPPGAAQPPERAQLCLRFTTPIELKQLQQHIRVTPEPEGLADGWYEGPCEDAEDAEDAEADHATDRTNSVLLAARHHYVVSLAADLTDVFGQTLGRSQNFEFDTSDRIPGLWTATGVGSVLEAGRHEHAVGVLNLNALEMRCMQLQPAQLALAFEGISSWIYGAHYEDRMDAPPPPPWQTFGLSPRSHLLESPSKPNTARTLPLDLGGSCATRSDQPGIYALELTPRGHPERDSGSQLQGDTPGRLLANVTDLGVVAKRGERSAIVWVTRLSNGSLVGRAAVELLDPAGHVLARARTDARGLARLPRLPRPLESELFVVRAGADLAVVGTNSVYREGLSAWQLGARELYRDDVRLFVHTDRGVYRPGERVFVHGLARRLSDRGPARVPDERAVKLLLQVEAETLLERTLPLSDFGSFATEIDLPAHVPPGSHVLQVELAGKIEYYPLSVAEFKPLSFELTGGPQRDQVLSGEAIALELAGQYLFGTPLSAAELQFTVEAMPGAIRASDFPELSFEDNAPALPEEEPIPQSPAGVVLERAGKTDAQGRARFEFVAEARRRPVRYAITAAATDQAQDRAARTWSVLAHSGERYAGAKLARFVMSADEPISAQVVVVDRLGKPVAGNAEISLRREHWDCADPIERCRVRVEAVGTQTLQVGADAPASVTFPAGNASGRIHVRACTRDSAGRTACASDSGFVWSREAGGPYDDRIAAELSVDRRSYAIGDRARLALQTALAPTHWLVTSERADLLAAQVVARDAGLPAVALGANSAPNVFVTMTGMTPRAARGEAGRPRLVSGAHEVRVEGPSRRLTAQIELARDHYQPKERIEGELLVSHLGRPITAEVALAVVNESVLQLTGFETPDPSAVFSAPRGLSVSTTSNITQVVADPARAAAVPETARVGTPGEDGGGGRPELRNDYVAAAYVAPDLRTDERGRVKFAFDAPTDLSAYRLMAVLAAKDDRVGSAEARLSVAQPLSAHLIAPRFVSRGDELELGARVHDSSGAPGPTALRFEARALALEHPTQQLDATAAGTLARTRAIVQDADSAYFEVELHKGALADRVRHTLAVRRPLDSELRVLAVGRGPKARARLDWPTGVDPELSALEITLDRTGLAALAPSLATLLHYPYGCTEQTAAALLALASAPELASAIAPELGSSERLRARLDDGIARLMQARAPDGQFGLYPGMAGRLWLTALVLEAALAVRATGMMVPESLTGGAANVLANWLSQQNPSKLGRTDLELAAHAALLLARAGTPPSPAIAALAGQAKQLSASAIAHVLHAAALANEPEAVRAPLRAAVRQARWTTQARDPETPLASAERSAALALSALLADAQDADAPLRDQLARWLIDRAADPERYLSTRDIADALSALTSWARGSQAGAGNVRIGLGKEELWRGPLRGAQVVALTRSSKAARGGAEVWVEAEGGDVSYSLRRRDVSVSAPKPAFAHGLSLERRYFQRGTNVPIGALALGDVVQVELEVRTERPVRMLALEDPLPAGLEPLDPGLASGRVAGCDQCSDLGAFDHARRHDDKLEAFAEWLPAGRHVLRYLLRATTRGKFSAPGAHAALMYLPDVFARSRVDTLVVK